MTGKGRVVLKFKSTKTVTRLRIPDHQTSRLKDLENWVYDNQTGEAAIRVKYGAKICLFDPMEVL